MKTASQRKGRAKGSEMKREYRFDYRTARPNRFAEAFHGRTAIVLDADVASVFGSAESVNRLLRSVHLRASGQGEDVSIAKVKSRRRVLLMSRRRG